MITTLRLLVTKKCKRTCKLCCNKNFDLEKLPIIADKDYKKYKEILITGGEPFLYPDKLENLIKHIKSITKNTKIYIYTAQPAAKEIKEILKIVDGITMTIHSKKDIKYLNTLEEEIYSFCYTKSLRLNIFKHIGYFNHVFYLWKIKRNIVWIKNCPLPNNEDFKRIENLFI